MNVLAQFRGPWVYIDAEGHICTQPDEGRPHGAVVAHAGHHPGFIRQEAIGPLIAAGPELVDALVDAIEALAMCQPRTEHGARCQSAATLKGWAAIAKAKGGEA
ncbi:MAG: hypothetical protein J7517_16595 [Sphingobium yanoikuyae]|nr:hypothetical protein [Sphingobium yanoikuyae]